MRFWNKKFVSFVTILLFFVISTVFVVEAAFTEKTKYNWVQIGSVSVTAKARVDAIHTPQSINGTCSIQSYTQPATNINVIGFTYWQCDGIEPDGDIWFSLSYPGEVNNNSSSKSKSTGFLQNVFPAAGYKLKSWGTHDFNHNGANPAPWRPNNSVTTT